MKRQRLRLVGRWVVWVVTGLVLISIPVSVWAESGFGLQVAKNGQPYYPRRVEVGISRHHAVVDYYSSYSLHHTFSSGDPFVSGIAVEWMGYGPFPPVVRGWWALPSYSAGGGSSGPHKRFQMPLVFPAVLMVGWSVWLVRGVRSRRIEAGCCGGCGYSLAGLVDGVCPECGGGADDAAS